ncbi:VOC family protein [Mucilaginibacter auburnensis]|uniref:Catechol 2,3-dioxygenase-like lactoylglutathione lyase family enzyme n=1 Tax=Mucilaginibacter auburnensis TaxID=1457233 RepID=A0A2H9VS74_9SPHI|nr:VOC family protein [Mucilaginibacter auburnensis]PJJ83671.1 catechol 2,3-dioxygenase-like lactoylglutathione lyase family enzyme [Mucilaginibacter auburnensis]
MACPISYKRTDHINICVPIEKLEEAREFYRTIMGLKQIDRPEVFTTPGHWFAWADIELHIGVEPALPVSARHTAFEVTDVAAARRWLEQNHIKTYDEPLIQGRHRFTFYDSFGNRLELLEYKQ